MQWNFEPLWQGETCFIIAGGPSVRKQNLELLRGRKVMVINSSIHTVPWADACFFGDHRWWRQPDNQAAIRRFPGLVVTTADGLQSDHLTVVHKVKPPGLVKSRNALMMRRTSLSGALGWAVHLGVKRAVLLGADGKKETTLDKRGKAVTRCHHHDPHPWPSRPGCWERQKEELATIVKPLRKAGVEVLNASPGSVWADLWPIVRLEDVLDSGPSHEEATPCNSANPANIGCAEPSLSSQMTPCI